MDPNEIDARPRRKVIIVEPFYGGSHKQLIDWLMDALPRQGNPDDPVDVNLFSLPAKKWHWRARCSALKLAEMVDTVSDASIILFCSSVLNLSEFLSLRTDLAKKASKTVVYFHENQLVYPVQADSKVYFCALDYFSSN